MVKLVIEIPEDFLETIKRNDFGIYGGRIYDMLRAGKPLEEYHEPPITDKKIEIEENHDVEKGK